MLRKYFQDYQSDEDDDYQPNKMEEALYRQEHEKKKKKYQVQNSTKELYEEMKNDYYLSLKKKVKTDEVSSLEMAQKILSSESLKPNKRVVFAGKQFLMNEETGQLEMIEKKSIQEHPEKPDADQNPEEFQKRQTHIAYQYLNHVMRAIYNRSRKINSVGKSKLDWNGFVKQQGISDKLAFNRKGGEMENIKFLNKTKQAQR